MRDKHTIKTATALVEAASRFVTTGNLKQFARDAKSAAKELGLTEPMFYTAAMRYLEQRAVQIKTARDDTKAASGTKATSSLPPAEIESRAATLRRLFDEPNRGTTQEAQEWANRLYQSFDALERDKAVNVEALRLIVSAFLGRPVAKGKAKRAYKRLMEQRVHATATIAYESASSAGRSAA